MGPGRIEQRVAELLADARWAERAGDAGAQRALAAAALALDPGNAEARALLDGSARRMQMTLMFCDVVGSTALADARDPEDVTEILRRYRDLCAAAIDRYGGLIEDRRGDGLLVRFGYPSVHEDDARRAVLSGLEIVRLLQERPLVLDVSLQVRIAIHTGLVVLDRGEVVGAAANEAARLQALAEPDTVLISDATQALVGDHFELEPRGEAALPGVSRPIAVYAVRGERAPAKLDAGPSLTRFTGRGAELERVAALWRSAGEDFRRGEAATPPLLVSGAAGLGKTRLVLEAARAAGARRVACRCSSYHQTTSLHAFRPALEAICGFAPDDGAQDRLAKLRGRLGAGEGGDLPLLAAALGIDPATVSPPADVDPTKLRELALHAAAGLLSGYAADAPAMLFVDDVHWADESALDLLSVLLAAPPPGLLVVLAARPGFDGPWTRVQRLELAPLSRPELADMALELTGGAAVTDELIERSDGIPLFLQELVRSADALDRAPAAAARPQEPASRVPAALRDPLLARLALPGVDLDLAQVAATIGRDVDRALLQDAAGIDGEAFERKLGQLVAVGLVAPAGERTLRFGHELIREVAYETQRRSTCRERHSRIADLLGAGAAPARGDSGAAAFHLERALRYDEAIDAHLTGARAHQALGAHKEATSDLSHALGLVARLPDGPPRLRSEFAVRQLRSFSAVMTGGYSAPEPAEDHRRCVVLSEELGLELLPSLIGSWSYYCSRGDLAEADKVCATIGRAIRAGGLTLPAEEMGRGVTSFFKGDFAQAREQMETFVAHPWPNRPGAPPDGWPLPNDPLSAVTAHLVPTLWIGGDASAARAAGERAHARAAGLEFPFGPFSTGYVHSQVAIARRLEGDHAAAGAIALELMAIGERHGFALWTLAGVIQHGLSRVHAGEAAALEPLQTAVDQWRELLAAEVWTPYWLTELGVVQALAGRPEDARRTLDEALAVADGSGSRFYAAETYRIRGELRRRAGDPQGTDDIRAALELARAQRATAFEWRAAVALGASAGRPRPRPVASP